MLLDVLQLIGEKLDLRRRSSRRGSAKQDQRWPRCSLVCEDRSEVGVGGDDDSAFLSSARENDVIRLAVDPVRPDVDRVVTKGNEPRSHDRRQGVVDQESHEAVSGRVRSLTASAA